MSSPPEVKKVRSPSFSPLDWIYYTRALLGVLAGLLAGMMGFITPNLDAWRGILLAVAFYSLSYYLSRYIFASQLPKGKGRSYLTLGIGSFIMLFLFTWILYNTLVTFGLIHL